MQDDKKTPDFSKFKFNDDSSIAREHFEEGMRRVYQAILEGKIYVQVANVAKSGLSRRLKFYMIEVSDEGKPYISRITSEIAWLRGAAPIGQYSTAKKRADQEWHELKYFAEEGLKVEGCGMDMVFHTLYCCLEAGHRDGWNQHYNWL